MKTITKYIRQERRQAAETRKTEYDKLSFEEKMARLPMGGASKQRKRFAKITKPIEM